MIRVGILFVVVLALANCGGSQRSSSSTFGGSGSVLFATGPIQQACKRAGRKAASAACCGCIQAVANRELSASDQRRGARYFSDPHALQEVRQSDNSGNERFWRLWKAYGQRASELCQGT